jgi:Tol biopolymer transport system component
MGPRRRRARAVRKLQRRLPDLRLLAEDTQVAPARAQGCPLVRADVVTRREADRLRRGLGSLCENNRSDDQDRLARDETDGRTIAFARQDHGPQTIYLTRPDGRATHRLTLGRSPSWSPDGKNLAFVRGGAIYRIGIDGQGRTRVVSGLVHPLVRWSPDGRKLLYTTGNNSGVDAWVVDIDGTHRRRLLHHEPIEGIAWRPGFG